MHKALKKTINIHEAKTHLSQLLQFAAQGNEVIICKAGTPLAKLSAIEPEVLRGQRPLGLFKGEIYIAEDFDVMPDWFNAYFEPEKNVSD
jgi:prevent-host-death family protein